VGEARLRRTSRFGEPGAPGPNGETGARSPSDQAFSNGRHGRPSCRTPPWHPHRSTIEIRNILLDVPAGTVYVRYTGGACAGPAARTPGRAAKEERSHRAQNRDRYGAGRAGYLVTWRPRCLIASLPHCLIASLPHCLEASLPSQKKGRESNPIFRPGAIENAVSPRKTNPIKPDPGRGPAREMRRPDVGMRSSSARGRRFVEAFVEVAAALAAGRDARPRDRIATTVPF